MPSDLAFVSASVRDMPDSLILASICSGVIACRAESACAFTCSRVWPERKAKGKRQKAKVKRKECLIICRSLSMIKWDVSFCYSNCSEYEDHPEYIKLTKFDKNASKEVESIGSVAKIKG